MPLNFHEAPSFRRWFRFSLRTMLLLIVVASMPLYGKLSDLYGRRRVFLAAITIFLVASMACGAAPASPGMVRSRSRHRPSAAIACGRACTCATAASAS